MSLSKTGIYLHIPFCIQKCFYCDFLTLERRLFSIADLKNYSKMLQSELIYLLERFCTEKTIITSVYFGGGTPSLLPADLITNLLETISSHAILKDNIEITLEADPKTIGLRDLKKLRNVNVNRLSIGAQSFDDNMLKNIGRYHRKKDILKIYDMARQAGFNNISLDLIYGLPDQTLASWEKDLKEAVKLSPEHLSLYSLNLARGTDFFRGRKKYKFPDDDLQILFYNRACSILSKAGIMPYEISNFSKKTFQSKHNTDCWDRKNYLGAGLGASSFVSEKRFKNTGNLTKYQDKISKNGPAWTDVYKLKKKSAKQEFIFLQLRKKRGFSRKKYFNCFGCYPEDDFPALLSDDLKRFIVTGKQYYLKKRGIHVSNEIFEVIF